MEAGNTRAHRLGVLGWPVAHSRSPAMHNAALRQLGMTDWRYQLLPVPPAEFGETVRALPELGFAGANVTIPHKQQALELADQASDAARQIGAANTLCFRDGARIFAENTDAPGLLGALAAAEPAIEPRGASALVLGAGGSARAIVWALLQAGAGPVLIWSRRAGQAKALAGELGGTAVARPQPADLLVNCTPVGLAAPRSNAAHLVQPAMDNRPERAGALEQSAMQADALNQLALTHDQLVEYSYAIDLVYRDGPTELMQAARAAGLQVLGGREILLHQGALSFALWLGREAPLAAMRAALRGTAEVGSS